MKIGTELIYKGQKCHIVFIIPVKDRDNKIQGTEVQAYLSYPFNYRVSLKELKNDK